MNTKQGQRTAVSIMDETERTSVVTANQRSYVVPKDVADAFDSNMATIARLTSALQVELAHHESKKGFRASFEAYHKERVDTIRSALASASQPEQKEGAA